MALFKFEEPDQFNETVNGSPIKGGAKIIKPEEGIVNVVNDFAWTINPKTSRKDTPYIHMIERKLTNDVMIQQLLYNISAAFQVGQQTTVEIFETVKNRLGLEENEAETVTEKIGAFIGDPLDPTNPYQGLYDLDDTGWQYVFPYFDTTHHSISATWGEPGDQGSGIISKAITAFSSGVSTAATGVNQIISALGSLSGETDRTRPGTYIERAKQYNFQPSGPSYSFTFNLLNTIKVDDVIRNWELCFALMYNLLPNRRTKTVFDPPPLYEIYIPGVRRSPISFIKGMRVDFVGATRLMDLSVAEQDKLRCIVPDAYVITIDIEDVLPESKNFMESMIDSEKRIRVSTRTEGETINRDFTVNDDMSKKNDIIHISLNKNQTSGRT